MTSELETVMKVRKLRREDRKLSLAEQVDTKPPKLAPLERDVQKAVIKALTAHPRVVKVLRINAGTFRMGGRYISGAPEGVSDVLGMLDCGTFFCCELKRPGEKPKPEQQQFLDEINRNGGVGFVACDVADVYRALGPVKEAA